MAVGLGGRLALLQEQMKKAPCERCKLLYNHKKRNKCPHCGNLNEADLQIFLAKREAGFRKRKSVGKWFLIVALIIILVIVLMNL